MSVRRAQTKTEDNFAISQAKLEERFAVLLKILHLSEFQDILAHFGVKDETSLAQRIIQLQEELENTMLVELSPSKLPMRSDAFQKMLKVIRTRFGNYSVFAILS
jgi:hypothetical protein